jgi:hypothetical protein
MSDNRHENESGLIIDPALLANIQAACRRRAAELEAAGTPQQPPESAGSSQGVNGKLCSVNNLTDAERFAAAVPDMPANVRRFFQAEETFVSPRQLERAQDRLEREARASVP